MVERTGEYHELYCILKRGILLLAGTVIALWFLSQILLILLFFIFAVILAVALNRPVTWLENRGVHRTLGTAIVGAGVLGVTTLIGWLVIPQVLSQAIAVGRNFPDYLASIDAWIGNYIEGFPGIVNSGADPGGAWQLPSLQTALLRVGRYTLSTIFLLVLFVLLITTVLYTVAHPRPLVSLYLEMFPVHRREAAARAFAAGSRTVNGWIWSNVLIGGAEAVMVTIFLSYIGVPGAFVWGVLAFFAELIPQVGAYLMATPPVLVALALDPMTAVWVAIFYTVMNQVMGAVAAPLIRARQMDIHPVSLMFTALALGSAFGILGAFIATPLTGYIKAFYTEFYLARLPVDEMHEERVDQILNA